MKAKCVMFLLLPACLAGCAAAPAGEDPVHQQRVAELKQAWLDGSMPVTEKQFAYPAWHGASPQQQAAAR